MNNRQRWPKSARLADKRRQLNIKLRPGEPRISAASSFLGRLAVRDQKTVAQILNISRQRVQQLERQALYKCRNQLHEFLQ